MPTPEEKWICDECILFKNKIHDSLDAVRVLLRGYNPNSWIGEAHGLSAGDLREAIKSFAQAARNNYSWLTEFITAFGLANVGTAFTACGYDGAAMKAQVNTLNGHTQWILDNADTATIQDALDYCAANVPRFIKIQRRWEIE